MLTFCFSGASSVHAGPDQGESIEVLEHAYFSIVREPTPRRDGVILIERELDNSGQACIGCDLRLDLPYDLTIKVGGNVSAMSMEQFVFLPRQEVIVELLNGQLLSIGMVNVERGTRYRNDI